MRISERAEQIVAELDKRAINPYVSLAKVGVFFSVLLLIAVIVNVDLKRDAATIVQAVQVLTVICLSVMGWHGYQGSRVLYLLRHMRGDTVPVKGKT